MFFKIILNKLWYKRLSSTLCILLMSFGITIISLMILMGDDINQKLRSNANGIDMVIGAKGSPLQLILSSVYQIDSPTGNIKLSEIENLVKNPLIKSYIPLSFGDNYKGYRIVGTNSKYYEFYECKLSQGKLPKKPLEVAIGYAVAKSLNLKIGNEFLSSHGLDKEGEHHEEEKFKVVGIIEENKGVSDNLILTPLSSIWDIHHADSEDLEITAALIKFRSPMGLMTIPRNINQNTNLMAALPAIEIDRLLKIFDYAILSLKILALLIVIISGISVFISLYNSLKENKHENAMMLAMGSSRLKVFNLLLFEGLILSFLGYIFGIIFSRVLIFVLNYNLSDVMNLSFKVSNITVSEIYLFLLALLVGILAAIMPALSIFKMNISKNLAED